jgi:SpoIID/LytB domain protein
MSRLKLSRSRLSLFCLTVFLQALVCSCAQKESVTRHPEEVPQPAEAKKTKEPSAAVADIDRALTKAATEALGDREGSVLVMDPRTGRLRAAVNPRLAFEQAFPPGSTIKSFTALTALQSGLIDQESLTSCKGRFTTDGLDVVCSHPKSNTPFNLSRALGYSCNYYFATLSGRISFGAFRRTLAAAGFGEKTGINASGESDGMLRDGDWRVRDLLGEGDNILVTPIQLLTAYCALFNGGHLLRPQTADAVNFNSSERRSLHIEESQRAALIKGMRGAIEYGTAEKAELSKLPIFVFGKTGTSTSSNGFRRQGWFVSFAADAHSATEVTPESLELAVLVFVKRSHGSDAAVVSHRVFEEYARIKGGEEAQLETPQTKSAPEAPGVKVKLISENRVVTLSLEDYVIGVLSVEAAVEDQIEALRAQAIISRTYALKNIGRHSDEGFDLCSNTHCQQYVGDQSRTSEKMRRAVADTAGEVLLDEKGELADVYFHAACGGHTANFESLWGSPGPVYLRGVRDDYCASMPNRDWTDEIPASKLVNALASDPITDCGKRIDDIVVTRRDETGRAESISIEGARRRQVRGWVFKLIVGRSLGWNLLKSSRFSVTRSGANFVFRGTGFGHGLGLCQNGAHVMARRGSSSAQILEKYFPGTTVSREHRDAISKRGEDGLRYEGAVKEPIVALRACSVSLTTATAGIPRSYAFVGPAEFLSSEHFHVNYPSQIPRPDVETALRVLEAARIDMLSRFAPASLLLPQGGIDVFVHESTQKFIAATGQPSWAAGASKGRRIELQPLAVLKRRGILASTLRHEYAHAVIEAIAAGTAPRWLIEGLAISFAGEGKMLVRFRTKDRLPLSDLEQRLAHPKSPVEMRALYAAAFEEVQRLIRAEGEPAVWSRLAESSRHKAVGTKE